MDTIWRWHDMTVNVEEDIVRIVILDISGIYAQIHNQGYFDKNSIESIQNQYSNKELWRVLVLD